MVIGLATSFPALMLVSLATPQSCKWMTERIGSKWSRSSANSSMLTCVSGMWGAIAGPWQVQLPGVPVRGQLQDRELLAGRLRRDDPLHDPPRARELGDEDVHDRGPEVGVLIVVHDRLDLLRAIVDDRLGAAVEVGPPRINAHDHINFTSPSTVRRWLKRLGTCFPGRTLCSSQGHIAFPCEKGTSYGH
jgi:hypothetical protein